MENIVNTIELIKKEEPNITSLTIGKKSTVTTTGETVSVNIGNKTFGILALSMFAGGTPTFTFVCNGNTYQCDNNNGTLMTYNTAPYTYFWINNKDFKDEVITSASLNLYISGSTSWQMAIYSMNKE